jgi:NADPH-dependent ferric siderophore reductase
VPEVDVDHDILWEVPADDRGELHVWLAGEAGVIGELRRLIVECGLGRRRPALMGYWRRGRTEDGRTEDGRGEDGRSEDG